MQQDIQQTNVVAEDFKRKLDEALIHHMEMSVGASQGFSGFSFDITTISCVVVLAERESEMALSPTDPPERFTQDSLLEELEDMGLDSNKDVVEKVTRMLDKGYIDVEFDGSLLAGKLTMEMASLLDKAFPGMPGMNLVAYLVQIQDEVLSGRKDPALAITHLDQTLKMHGAGLSHKSSQVRQEYPSGKDSGRNDTQRSAQGLKSALSAALRKRQAKTGRGGNADSKDQPKLVTANGTVKTILAEEIPCKPDKTADVLGQQLEGKESLKPTPPAEKLESTWTEEGCSDAAVAQQPDLPENSDGFSESIPDFADETAPQTTQAPEASTGEPHAGEVCESQSNPVDAAEETLALQKDKPVLSEEVLEERISAFEQKLTIRCPLCNVSDIEEKETAKGKIFYVCTRQECIFVSWGKPYHLECPWCKNPFLIEATVQPGKVILRCPRATCGYQQRIPEVGENSGVGAPATIDTSTSSRKAVRKPRKKKRVVRRRVVRRKR